jgi:hypothetical protein
MINSFEPKLPYQDWSLLKKHLECLKPHLQNYFPDFLIISPSKKGKSWLSVSD